MPTPRSGTAGTGPKFVFFAWYTILFIEFGFVKEVTNGYRVVEDNSEDCVLLRHSENNCEEYRLMTNKQTFDAFHNRVLYVIFEINKWLKKRDASSISFFHLQKQPDE